MKKLRRYGQWFVFNAVLVGLVYTGVILGSEGFERILIFVVLLMVVASVAMSLTVTSDKEKEKAIAKIQAKGFIPLWMDGSLDLVIVGVFLYYGWIFTGVMYAFHAMFMLGIRYEVGSPAPSSPDTK
jgi:hypothetical protein